MTDLILHHYEASPFSEKVRLIMGHKGLTYHSVRAPAVMPKPDLVALTGGYRRMPILQMGCHVYCDTALIARKLEAVAPNPTLYPSVDVELIAEWADTNLFEAAVSLSMRPTRLDEVMQLLTPEELMKFRDDRLSMRTGARRVPPAYETARSAFAVYAARLEEKLRNAPFISGVRPAIADFSAYHCCWFVRMLTPESLDGFPTIAEWMQRIAAIGHGTRLPMTSEEAIGVAAAAGADLPALPAPHQGGGVVPGARVQVRADDYGRDPVEGTVVIVETNEVAVRRRDERAGDVVVHFPRVGYDVIPL